MGIGARRAGVADDFTTLARNGWQGNRRRTTFAAHQDARSRRGLRPAQPALRYRAVGAGIIRRNRGRSCRRPPNRHECGGGGRRAHGTSRRAGRAGARVGRLPAARAHADRGGGAAAERAARLPRRGARASSARAAGASWSCRSSTPTSAAPWRPRRAAGSGTLDLVELDIYSLAAAAADVAVLDEAALAAELERARSRGACRPDASTACASCPHRLTWQALIYDHAVLGAAAAHLGRAAAPWRAPIPGASG